METSLIIALARVFNTYSPEHTEWPRFEYESWCPPDYLTQAEFAIQLQRNGFTILPTEVHHVTYLEKSWRRVAVIAPTTSFEHRSYAVESPARWHTLDGIFKRYREDFEPVPSLGNSQNGTQLTRMYKHHRTNSVIQITWRQKQIFPSLFSS